MPHDPSSGDEERGNPSQKKPSRGLWELMGRETPPAADEELPSQKQDEESAENPDRDVLSDEQGAPSRPRSLWAMMQSGAIEDTGTVEKPFPDSMHETTSDQEGTEAALPLEIESQVSSEPETPKAPPPIPLKGEPETTIPTRTQVLGEGSSVETEPEELTPAQRKALLQEKRRIRKGQISLVLGVMSVALAALAIQPEIWKRIPATLVGFLAVGIGMLVLSDKRRSRGGSATWIASGGILLGGAGMLLGPTVFAEYGNRLRRTEGRQQTREHLELIGAGLEQFHGKYHRYPIGGQFEGEDGIHGWMTSLLPYVGEQELYLEIDPNVPYDDPRNQPAMQTLVTAYLASGSSQDPVVGGLAPTHFSGLGGEWIDPRRGLLHVGIFGKNQEVSREDIFDGLSQTLVAGEIAQGFPAWGSPQNWRQIGKGLNKDVRGFGNADRTGAMFLHADGSVRFYTNSISPEVLQKLSTRDGEEAIGKLPE